jgi:hypothetical protein
MAKPPFRSHEVQYNSCLKTSEGDFRENGRRELSIYWCECTDGYVRVYCENICLMKLKNASVNYVPGSTIWSDSFTRLQPHRWMSSQHKTFPGSQNALNSFFRWHRAIGYKFTYISKKHIASFFRTEEEGATFFQIMQMSTRLRGVTFQTQ